MRRLSAIVVGGLLLGGGPAFTQGPVPAPEAIAKATTPEIPFDSVPNFLTMPPGVYMGEGVGVATNSKGHVFVYTRSGETRCSNSIGTAPSSRSFYTSNSNDPESMDHGEIYKVRLNGQIVGKFGKAGKMPKEFGMVNSIACRTENDLCVGEIWNWRAQKVTVRR